LKIFEPLADVQDKVRQYWVTLNPRERIILSVLAGVMSLLVVAVVIKQSVGFVFNQASQAEDTLKNITKIQRLSETWIQQRGELLRYERMRGRRGDNFDLIPFINDLASKYGTTVTKISPTRPSSATKDMKADWVEVKLGGTTSLSSAMKLLRSIEEPLGVRIHELTIKPQFSDKTKVEVRALVVNLTEL